MGHFLHHFFHFVSLQVSKCGFQGTQKIDSEAAIRAFEEARKINPNDAQIYHGLGGAHICIGQAAKAIPMIEQAMRLSPTDAMTGLFYGRMASARLFLNEHDEAIAWGYKAVEKFVPWIEFAFLISALGHAGRIEDADRVRRDVDKIHPGLTISVACERLPVSHPAYLDCLAEGLRAAGTPEA